MYCFMSRVTAFIYGAVTVEAVVSLMTSLPEKKARVFEYLAKASMVANMLCRYTALYEGAGS